MPDLSPFLKHGVILAFLKPSGKIPVVMLRFRIFVMGAAIIGALILKNLALRPSSPVAFERSGDSNWPCTNVRETGGITNFTSGDKLVVDKAF